MIAHDFRTRVAERAREAGVDVAGEALDQLEAYYLLLVRWNAVINLTGVDLKDTAGPGLDRLFIEPLAAARFVPEIPLRWLDLGSGGGSPALPLKIVRPAAELTMVETKARKVAFLQEAVRTLALPGVTVVHGPFDALASEAGARASSDVVTVRALRADERLLDAAAVFLRPGGRLLLFRSIAEATMAADGRFEQVESARLAGSLSCRVTVLERRAEPAAEA